MPTFITPPFVPPIPRFTPSSGQIVGPADGDALLASSVNNAFTQLADRSALSFFGLYGVYGSRLVASCVAGTILTINFQTALRSSSGILSGTVGSPIDVAVVLGGAPAPSTWYYVYGADVGGVLTPIVSTDPPDTALKYRAGNSDQAFLTLFRTDGAGFVRQFSHYEGCYSYHGDISVFGRADPGTVTPAAVALPDVPGFARIALIQATIYNVDPLLTAQMNLMYPASSLWYALPVGKKGALDDIRQQTLFKMPINGPTGFEVIRDGGSGTADFSAVLQGFLV